MTTADLVLGIDLSTTAAKAAAFDTQGRMVALGRAPLALARPGPDRFEQDPGDWWTALCRAIADVTAAVNPARIAGLAIAHQRETFACLDAGGRPLRPAMLWLDGRARGHLPSLVRRIGTDRLRALSGKAADFGPALPKIAWLAEEEPETHARTALFCDVQAYLVQGLTGRPRTSWASADPLALFDIGARRWSDELCRAVGIAPDRLPEACAPGTPLGAVTPEAAAATGLRAGTPVLAGGGDGQMAGLGVDALDPRRAYLNLGTAVVFGVWSPEPRQDEAWRTMTSASGRGYVLESSLRSGALLSDWFLRRLLEVEPRDAGIMAALEAEAAALPPGSGGLLLLPYWEGAMNPHWDPDARGAILGLSDAHGRAHVYRALIEGVALEQALVLDLMRRRAGIEVAEFVAVGGVAASDLWCGIMADATGVAIQRSTTVEAACLGAAMCAAAGAGLAGSIEAAAGAMRGAATATFHPRSAARQRYAALLGIYRDVYPQLSGLMRRLSDFARDQAPAEGRPD
ncbi:xylulokinase [Arenibaculum pallidiluteum]|uniref:xylulokinase n=1 Tax=Arenibaculum pallidiluteum TaxID=2812559 RepID=UPI001A95FB55|nr:FGGY-family carbohydrate kinase [Arenibaculum pallidiluteum]